MRRNVVLGQELVFQFNGQLFKGSSCVHKFRGPSHAWQSMRQQQPIARTTGIEAGINVKKAISLFIKQVSNSLHPRKDTQGKSPCSRIPSHSLEK